MLFEKDYLTRMFRSLGTALGQMISLKKAEKYQEALDVMDRTSQQLLGLNGALLRHLPYDLLMDMLQHSTQQGIVKCLILADLFKEEGDIYEAQGNRDQEFDRYIKALNIYLDILLDEAVEPPLYAEQLPKVDVLIEALEDFVIPAETRFKLVRFYEDTQRYARAEDILFQLIDEDENYLDAGIAFYERVRLKSDVELSAGNLPRDEVEASLNELRERAG